MVAVMPYRIRKSCGFTLIGQPPLTQALGPWLHHSSGKYAKQLSREKDLMESLTLNMNNVRRAGITKELAEIVGGAEALQTA